MGPEGCKVRLFRFSVTAVMLHILNFNFCTRRYVHVIQKCKSEHTPPSRGSGKKATSSPARSPALSSTHLDCCPGYLSRVLVGECANMQSYTEDGTPDTLVLSTWHSPGEPAMGTSLLLTDTVPSGHVTPGTSSIRSLLLQMSQ